MRLKKLIRKANWIQIEKKEFRALPVNVKINRILDVNGIKYIGYSGYELS